MSPPIDWLSRLLHMVPVSGRVELRCLYGAPWQVVYDPSPPGEIPYHVVLAGSAIVEDYAGGPRQRLEAGDIVLLPTGAAHRLHDGSGAPPLPVRYRAGVNQTFSDNAGTEDRLDLLCGRFILAAPHDRLLGGYLPSVMIVRGQAQSRAGEEGATSDQLAALVSLMRGESDRESLGGEAMLNAFSAALFTLALRMAGQTQEAPVGLLALAGHPRLAPALAAMFQRPEEPWTLPELARLCNMSRATLARHFQEKLGRSASDLLLDIRMTIAANRLKQPGTSTAAAAEAAGYQSEAAFQRVFKQRMGRTPAQWRRATLA